MIMIIDLRMRMWATNRGAFRLRKTDPTLASTPLPLQHFGSASESWASAHLRDLAFWCRRSFFQMNKNKNASEQGEAAKSRCDMHSQVVTWLHSFPRFFILDFSCFFLFFSFFPFSTPPFVSLCGLIDEIALIHRRRKMRSTRGLARAELPALPLFLFFLISKIDYLHMKCKLIHTVIKETKKVIKTHQNTI